jgi:hypothetical protein
MPRSSQDALGFHRDHKPLAALRINAVAAFAAASALTLSLVVSLTIISFEILRSAGTGGLL